jgi:tripartite ATP-independent transporter DctP family solute receptor
MKRKSLISVAMLLILTLSLLTACGGGSTTPTAAPASAAPSAAASAAASAAPATAAPSVEPVTLKLGHIGSLENEYNLMAEKFKEEVETRTEGRYLIEIYPARQLGGDLDIIQGMQSGNIDAGVVTSSPMVNSVASMGVLDLPYLFQDWDHIEAFAESEDLQNLLKEGEAAGLVNLAVLPRGFRSMSNDKHPITTPSDLSDIKIRIIESPVFVDTFNLLPGTAVPMAAGEVYTALQQGTIDAQENTPGVMWYEHFYEVQNYFDLTQHMSAWGIVSISKITWDKIPAADQQLIREAAMAAQETQTVLQKQSEADFLTKLEEKGMTIGTDVDKDAFAALVGPVVDAWTAKNGSTYVDAIKGMA